MVLLATIDPARAQLACYCPADPPPTVVHVCLAHMCGINAVCDQWYYTDATVVPANNRSSGASPLVTSHRASLYRHAFGFDHRQCAVLGRNVRNCGNVWEDLPGIESWQTV